MDSSDYWRSAYAGARGERDRPVQRPGRQIVAVGIPAEAAVGGMPAGTAQDGLSAMFADYTAHGFRGGNDFMLLSILRRDPRTVAQFIAELPR